MRNIYCTSVLLATLLFSCGGPKSQFNQVENWLADHCGCGQVSGQTIDIGKSPAWDFVLEDCAHADNSVHAQSMISGLENDIEKFCEIEFEISITYLKDGVYDPHVYEHCFPYFQF